MENILKGRLGLVPQDAPLYAVHIAKSATGKEYRLVYEVPNGFIEVEVNHNEIEEKLEFKEQQEFIKKENEALIILDKDPKAMEVY